MFSSVYLSYDHILGVYIYCDNILDHFDWALNYDDNITGLFENSDELLARLIKDIGYFLKEKGDTYEADGQTHEAQICFEQARKLLFERDVIFHAIPSFYFKIVQYYIFNDNKVGPITKKLYDVLTKIQLLMCERE